MKTSATPARVVDVGLVDEFGSLYIQIQAQKAVLKPMQDRLGALESALLSSVSHLSPEDSDLLTGQLFQVEVSKASVEKSWKSLSAVQKAVGGWQALAKIATISFKAVAGVIGNTAAEALQSEERTGARRLKATALLSRPCERILSDSPKAA